MQKTKEARSKDEVLADLYALRAGLGVIYEELQVIEEIGNLPNLITNVLPAKQQKIKTEIESTEKQYQLKWNEINQKKADLEREKANLAREKANLGALKKSLPNETTGVEKFEEYAQASAKNRNYWLRFLSIATGILGILVAVFFLGIYWLLMSAGQDGIVPLFYAIFLVPPLPILSFFLNKKYKNNVERDRYWELSSRRKALWVAERERIEAIESSQRKVKSLEETIVSLEETIVSMEGSAETLEEYCRIEKKAITDVVEKISESQKALEKYEQEGGVLAHSQKIECIETALHKIYDSWLDERDWKNVDLIIYYFETGRVDSLKEALWHVDRQRQADNIVKAIYTASSAISNSIERSMQRLGEGLSKSFAMVSVQIAEVAKLQDANIKIAKRAMESNEQAMKQLKNKLSEQIEGIDLNNSLLKNIETGSHEIMSEWNYIRQKYSL